MASDPIPPEDALDYIEVENRKIPTIQIDGDDDTFLPRTATQAALQIGEKRIRTLVAASEGRVRVRTLSGAPCTKFLNKISLLSGVVLEGLPQQGTSHFAVISVSIIQEWAKSGSRRALPKSIQGAAVDAAFSTAGEPRKTSGPVYSFDSEADRNLLLGITLTANALTLRRFGKLSPEQELEDTEDSAYFTRLAAKALRGTMPGRVQVLNEADMEVLEVASVRTPDINAPLAAPVYGGFLEKGLPVVPEPLPSVPVVEAPPSPIEKPVVEPSSPARQMVPPSAADQTLGANPVFFLKRPPFTPLGGYEDQKSHPGAWPFSYLLEWAQKVFGEDVTESLLAKLITKAGLNRYNGVDAFSYFLDVPNKKTGITTKRRCYAYPHESRVILEKYLREGGLLGSPAAVRAVGLHALKSKNQREVA